MRKENPWEAVKRLMRESAPEDQPSRLSMSGGDTWRSAHKERVSNRIAFALIAALALAGWITMLLINPTDASPGVAPLRSFLLVLCPALAVFAATLLVWRWKD